MLFTVTQDSRAGQVNMKRGLWTTICLRWVPSFVKDLCNRYISFHKTLYVSDCLTFRNCCHVIKLQQQIRVSSATRVRYKYLSQHHPILLIQPNHTGDKNTPMYFSLSDWQTLVSVHRRPEAKLILQFSFEKVLRPLFGSFAFSFLASLRIRIAAYSSPPQKRLWRFLGWFSQWSGMSLALKFKAHE